MIEVRLRGLKALLLELCPPFNSEYTLKLTGDNTAEVICQYEGHACILEGRFYIQKNIAELVSLGYEKLIIKFGGRVISTVETALLE